MVDAFICPEPFCIMCVQQEQDPGLRREKFITMFERLPEQNEDAQVMALSSLSKSTAVQPELCKYMAACGVVTACRRVLEKAVLRNIDYFSEGDRAFLPFYCLSILGSVAFVCDEGRLCRAWMRDGTMAQIVRLHAGDLSWIEQTAAARCLCNLNHPRSAPKDRLELATKFNVVPGALQGALDSFKIVYKHALRRGWAMLPHQVPYGSSCSCMLARVYSLFAFRSTR